MLKNRNSSGDDDVQNICSVLAYLGEQMIVPHIYFFKVGNGTYVHIKLRICNVHNIQKFDILKHIKCTVNFKNSPVSKKLFVLS